MPYKFKGKRDCTQSDGSKGKYQTVKKDGTKRCYKTEKQYKSSMAWGHGEADDQEDEEILKEYIKKIIREALQGNPDQKEAAYAVIYAEGYVQQFEEIFRRILNKNPKLGNQGEKWMPLSDAIGNIQAILIAGRRQVQTPNEEAGQPGWRDLPEEIDVVTEANDAADYDFESGGIYKCIEKIDVLVNRQTPMGMSAAEGLGVFGGGGGGVSFQDTAAGDARALIALMDNDNVLSWLDEVETMKRYGELK